MKSFIRLFVFFLSISSVVILLISLVSSLIVKNYSNFKLQGKPKYIVTGHSHPTCAFDDSKIPDFKNIAQTAESYFYTYFKTREVLKQNPSIEVVFIEFTNNQVDKNMNNWIWDDAHMSFRHPRYSSFMSLSDELLLIRKNPAGYLSSLSRCVRSNLIRLLANDFNYVNEIGGFEPLNKNKVDSLLNIMPAIGSHESENAIAEHNLKYLSLLIDFCQKNGKKVILIRSPQHNKYPGFRNELKYKETLNRRYATLDYMDFAHFPLSDSQFADLEHLNIEGAQVFSNWFSKLLDNGVLRENNKQEVIENAIRTYCSSTPELKNE